MPNNQEHFPESNQFSDSDPRSDIEVKDIVSNWEYANGELVETPSGYYNHSQGADAQLEKQNLLTAMHQRIGSNRFPWTAPGAELPDYVRQGLQEVHKDFTEPPEALPGDVFKVAPPIKKFEGSNRYAPEDEALLQTAGVQQDTLQFTREQLQRSGVFFLNRVGGGEQPLFGVPIPDPDAPGGFFNVQDRSFLTRPEFEKVYRYQQEQAYGLEAHHDPADIQVDMAAFAVLPSPRQRDMHKQGGFGGGRENKYGQARSPFVDLGFVVDHGVEAQVYDNEGFGRRMNTLTIHLVNAHPDYPGLSEMFDPDTTAHDQQYMSAGEFADYFYVPPPDEDQAFGSLRYGLQTRRENAWSDLR